MNVLAGSAALERLALGLAVLAALWPAWSWAGAAGSAPAEACRDPPGVDIFVGGTAGFDALRDGDQFSALLKSGRVGLYEHANALAAAEKVPGLIEAIEGAFSGTGAGQTELGQVGANYFTLPARYGYYQSHYVGHGLRPAEANVNTPSDSAAPGQLDHDIALWRTYVNAARSVGFKSVAPIIGPNGAGEPKLGDDVFATNPFYALERAEALLGGAMAFDVPPRFFLSGGSGRGYQTFVIQAIQWGNARGLRTTMLLSPYPWPTRASGAPVTFAQFTGNTFGQDTRTFVKRLIAEGAVPTQWAVDNYEDTHPDDAPAMIPETKANTSTGVALWLARNVPVTAGSGGTGPLACP